ncbi:MAG TPA: hypothetical protein VF516_43885 [Kofleriaceae bacterium]
MRHDRIDPAQNTTVPRDEDWQPDVIGKAHVDTGDAGAVVRERTERSAGDPWLDLKSRFVDDPAGAVADAEQLVRQAVDERIRELQDEAAAVFAHDDDDSNGDASTEGLRNRLIRYQAYCQRLAGRALH